MTHKNNKIVLFESKQIRKTWHNNQWYFSVIDIIIAVTDSINPMDYIKKIKKRDSALSEGWGQIVTPLPMETTGGLQNRLQ